MNQPQARTASIRRVVTAVDEQGRSYVLADGKAPNIFRSPTVPGFGAAQVWATEPGPVSNDGRLDPASADAEIPMYPELGGTIFRVADFPPDSVYEKAGKDQLFSDIGGDHAREEATHSGNRHFWFHKTDSIDFAVVIEGEIWLLLDEGECRLEAGDVIVQRGTAHAWSNRTDENCRVAFLLFGALPVSTDDTQSELAGQSS
ncbi:MULTISPECIES: cupin domain-containing protein [unclassified Rhodococcus (in: high G+C Gram-positive bacteria)]|uniref:cupin domain-containing protein n=1 Tax=unclassified Rhodococcus (in: high G+C Gram-positive bacteria) TaxID=192944 RepID=UPI0024B7AFD9|nr:MULTISPECIES: cupin domain-containing protein [unclassified Rhodococcus (in: high G+C Gram-positive bacteria)]MDI9948926.1 cupin domain-containing protein [Rhodococcus sp. IEGM 1305]MDI9978166.1 cupin domain-containing protein [Rhodococcus sp. IEGM 1307]